MCSSKYAKKKKIELKSCSGLRSTINVGGKSSSAKKNVTHPAPSIGGTFEVDAIGGASLLFPPPVTVVNRGMQHHHTSSSQKFKLV